MAAKNVNIPGYEPEKYAKGPRAKAPAAANPWLIAAVMLTVLVAVVATAGAGALVGVPAVVYVYLARRDALLHTKELTTQREALLGEQQSHGYTAAERDGLRNQIEALGAGDVVRLQEVRVSLQRDVDAMNQSRVEAEAQERRIHEDIERLRVQVVDLEDMVDLNDYGLYNFENPAQDSVAYGNQLKQVQGQIKECVRKKKAASSSQSWTVNGSKRDGEKMLRDMTKLLLRAYNAEAENSVKTVRAGHLATAQKRLTRSAEAVEKLGAAMQIRITGTYHGLRMEELRLTHAHLEAVKAAKEAEREARAIAREEAKAQKELMMAKAKQQKEVDHYRGVMEQLQAAGDAEAVARVSADLAAAEEKLRDVESTMANIRAGYVYVISNRGAFGEGIVKIGMTRRLDPDDRVRELGDASVPFYFDKHSMIFAKDAVGLERRLHQHFAAKRVNLVNMRREYFYVTPHEVRDALAEFDSDFGAQLVDFHERLDAAEYEASEEMRRTGRIPGLIPGR